MSNYRIDTRTIVPGLAVTLADGVLSVTIDRPESLNSLTKPVLAGMADAIEGAATDPRVKVVRLGGAGRGFSSGGAISVDDVWASGPPTDTVAEANRTVRAIVALPQPVVAVVQGPTVGCGVSLALACDLVLASDNAFFMLAHTNVGLMPDGGASALVQAAIGRIRAMHMALLPDRVPAAEALSWGLVSAVYPAADFDAEVDKLISRLLAGPALAIAKTKNAINAGPRSPSWHPLSCANWMARPSSCVLTTSPRAQRHSSSAGPPCSPAVERSRPASGPATGPRRCPCAHRLLQLLVGHVCGASLTTLCSWPSFRMLHMPDSGIAALTPVTGLNVTLTDRVLSVRINRPSSLNSLTVPILTGIADTLERAAADPVVKVVRLGGVGRGFSSGVSMSVDDVWGGGPPTAIVEEANRAVRAVAALPHPVVAVVQGPAVGVAVSLALACDFILASDSAFFMLANTKVALMPDGGASALVAAATGRIRAMRLALLAEQLPAREALAWGLISAVYPDSDFEAEVDKVISRLLAGPALAFAQAKNAINAAALTELEPTFARELDGQEVLLRTHDFAEGAAAFLQRRTPNFTGS